MSTSKLGSILIVEDEVELSHILGQMLKAQGYDVSGFTSGNKALTVLRGQPFDVLLADLMLPDLDGLTLLRQSLEIDPLLVAIIMTGQGTIQTAVEAMKAGAFDYVLKPLRLETLLPVLGRAMNSRHLRLENLQLRETVAIYELSQTVAFELDPQTVISRLADAVLKQTDADQVSILLPATDGRELYVAEVRGANRQGLLGARVPLEESISGWVARERSPLILEGEVKDSRFRSLWPQPHIRSSLSVPMHVPNKLIGTIHINALSRTRSFNVGQIKALKILANTAAAALETASLYGQVKQAEENYRSIFENASEGMFQTTPDGLFLKVNPAFARVLGYGSPAEVIHPVTGGERRFYLNAVERGDASQLQDELGLLENFEFEAYRKDGEKIWLSMNRRSVCDGESKEIYREGSIRDITERKRSLEALRQAEARTRAILESAMDCIITMNHEGVVVDWNPAAERTFGFSLDQIVGKPMADFVIPQRFREQHWRGLANYLATGVGPALDHRMELTALRSDGTEFPIELSITRIELNDFPMFTGYMRDITERKNAENRLAAQHAVTSALAYSNSLIEAAPSILQAICESLGWVWGALWTVDRHQEVLRCNEVWQSPSTQATEFEAISRSSVLKPGTGLPSRVWSDGKPYWIPDVMKDPSFTRAAIAATEGLHSSCGFPIGLGSEVLGIMEFFDRSIREPDPDLLAMMATIGSQIGQFMERKGAEERLRSSEEQLLQSQKLEAIGQLAGGVAHDFNNLLTVIGGYSSILLTRIGADSPHRIAVEEIQKASDRASSLTRQLLAFSRKQILLPKRLDLNEVVAGLERMLRRLIGEDIDLFTITDPALHKVKADPGQIEQLLLNLIVNARDAMPQGGKLTIETANVMLSDEYAKEHAATPGAYVMLAVSDSGCGMDSETKERIFEPFFTTKGAGKGTGLGLSTVYGIVKQSGGHIWLYSELDKGTTFKIYLPRIDEDREQQEEETATRATPRGTETVLLVEDDDQVRGILTDILQSQGYHVLVASGGTEALSLVSQTQGTIDLMITDVVMPQMGGRELATQIRALRSEIKILYMSGYTDDAIVRHGLLHENLNFLQKPFDSAAVARKVRQVLDSEAL